MDLQKECEITAALLLEELKKRGEKLTFAESCTAGLLSAVFCAVPGASEVFDGSLVSYANDVKAAFLGVPPATLQVVGAVSAAVCAKMAEGAARLFQADLALSVTGIAGPGGGSPEKPVGTVYVGCACHGTTVVERCLFSGARQEVRMQSVRAALELAVRTLNAQ